MIYRLFLEGRTFTAIAHYLENHGILSPGGKQKWQSGTIQSILTNEKYKGDALLQKCFTTDFLTKKMKKNEGEVPQYYVENSHPAIISADVFEMVQAEIKKRKDSPSRHSGVGIFGSRIFCGDCGAAFGAKVWHSTDKYRKVVYQCNHKFRGEKKCTTPTFSEEQIKTMFVTAVNRLIENKAEIIRNYEEMRDLIFDVVTENADRSLWLNEQGIKLVKGVNLLVSSKMFYNTTTATWAQGAVTVILMLWDGVVGKADGSTGSGNNKSHIRGCHIPQGAYAMFGTSVQLNSGNTSAVAVAEDGLLTCTTSATGVTTNNYNNSFIEGGYTYYLIQVPSEEVC